MKIFLLVLFTITLALPIKAQENQPTTPNTSRYFGAGLSLIAIDYGEPYDVDLGDGSTVSVDDNDYYATSSAMIDIVYGNNFSENKAFEIFYSSFGGSKENDETGLVWERNGNPLTSNTTIAYTAYGFAFVFYKPLSNANSRLYGRVGLASVKFDVETTFSGDGTPITDKSSYDDLVIPLQAGVEFDMDENLTIRIGYHVQSLDFSDEEDAEDTDDAADDLVRISGIMFSINNKF